MFVKSFFKQENYCILLNAWMIGIYLMIFYPLMCLVSIYLSNLLYVTIIMAKSFISICWYQFDSASHSASHSASIKLTPDTSKNIL